MCPLCCEELDLSDRQFYPCKCGYQVCMWCWHRIRESESGLCPACRTPYGDDPHEFSAVDVEEVLKANREKEAAAKRERERQRQQQQQGGSDGGIPLEALSTQGDDGGGGGLTGIMAVPKDRNQLANMRVIRRNLVYAVGLPPSISNEDTLNRPEYFGQYGKVSKIVINRSQVTNSGDPRRASCSAYVTFVHKVRFVMVVLAAVCLPRAEYQPHLCSLPYFIFSGRYPCLYFSIRWILHGKSEYSSVLRYIQILLRIHKKRTL